MPRRVISVTHSARGRHAFARPSVDHWRVRRRRPESPCGAAHHKLAVKRATLRDCARRCVYCGLELDLARATLDHVHPVARGGTSAPGNLVSACAPCNRRKGDMLPHDFFHRYPSAGLNFLAYARVVHRAHKRNAKRAVSLALAA